MTNPKKFSGRLVISLPYLIGVSAFVFVPYYLFKTLVGGELLAKHDIDVMAAWVMGVILIIAILICYIIIYLIADVIFDWLKWLIKGDD